MFVVLMIVMLLLLTLIVITHSFLQTRRRVLLWGMIGIACMIAIITIPWLMFILGIGTNIE